MKLTLLGTGTSQGVPVVACNCSVCTSTDWRDKHLRTSALIETDEGLNILIDIGPDFREQMLRHKVSHLDAILITHAHRDHVAGIDDIRSYNYVQQRAMDIYGNRVALDILKRDYSYIFSDHPFPGLPEATLHELSGDEPFMVGTTEVLPIKAMHKDMPILGYRIGAMGYLTDANHLDGEEMDKLRGLDTLVINALRKTTHFSHFSLPEALDIIADLSPRQAFITHVGHEMGRYEATQKELPPHVTLAYDGLSVNIINHQ